ncbi:hypothetical protein HanIR_Chr06g0294711 [Helianthus annuus]|nr:hypothetical protein HanIR_Chr06g0294711 [Helianthus annuus]
MCYVKLYAICDAFMKIIYLNKTLFYDQISSILSFEFSKVFLLDFEDEIS